MTKFVVMTPDGLRSPVRILNQSDMMKCPHFIMAPEHYRADGSCKCNDPAETIMRGWGYKWSRKAKAWVS